MPELPSIHAWHSCQLSQAKQGETWKTVFTGDTVGRNFTRQFPPVTAQHVRLNILAASEGPTIWELQRF